MLLMSSFALPALADKTGEQCSWEDKDDKGNVTKVHQGNMERGYDNSGRFNSYECNDGTAKKSAGYKLGWD